MVESENKLKFIRYYVTKSSTTNFMVISELEAGFILHLTLGKLKNTSCKNYPFIRRVSKTWIKDNLKYHTLLYDAV